jgi:hypothetical protein
MWEYEDVPENSAKELSNEIGALFNKTSAKNGTGIDVNTNTPNS